MIYTTFLDATRLKRQKSPTELWRRRVYFGTRALDAGGGDVHQVFNVVEGDVILNVWINVATACPANSTVDLGYGTVVDYWGNGLSLDAVGPVKQVIIETENVYLDLIKQGEAQLFDFTVDGASYNDIVSVMPDDTDMADMIMSGNVSWANTVTVRVTNLTESEVLIPSASQPVVTRIVVDKAPYAKLPMVFATGDTIDVKATTDTADVNINSGVIDVYALVLKA